MSISTVLLMVIGFLAVLQITSMVIIAYLMKRVLDDKPIAIKEMVAPGAPPEVITRADLKLQRTYQAEQNFKTKSEDKFVDLADLSTEQGMAELEKFYTGGEK